MQGASNGTQFTEKDGFLQNSFKQLNEKVQKPVFWLVISIFGFMTLAGYWLGSTMVIQSTGKTFEFTTSGQDSEINTYLLLETDDLSLNKPQLLSIWFVHLYQGDKPRLGFTPVVSNNLTEDENYPLLSKFSLDSKRHPTQTFLNSVNKIGFSTRNFILVDQTSSAAFINWFTGKELTDPIAIEQHTMAQFGQVLRGLCSSLHLPLERSSIDFPWSKITPDHFMTSLQFNQVIQNLAFLTSPVTPSCEMVPLP
jgi:hypothetical protein